MFARSKPPTRPAIPFGQRVYAVGDVHGEGGLLRRVLRLIEEDNAARREAAVTLVFLGDIVDRGPDAAALLQTFARMSVDHVVVIKGNHEEALVQAYRGDDDVLDAWMPFGAMATLTGFGITLKEIDSTNNVFTKALQSRIGPDLIEWLDALPSAWTCGGYYFTHAGVRPGVDLDEQVDADLRWIREPFLSSRRNHGKVIVHGHTVEPGTPALGGNRIGIDTGGHEHGVLTALGLEGERQWLLQASGTNDRDEVVAHDDVAGRSTWRNPAAADRLPMPDIAALIASIVMPTPPPEDAALLLVHEPAKRPPSSGSRGKGLGKGGVAAAGFALVLASLGGAFAVKSTFWPRGVGDVVVPIPELQGARNDEVPKAAPTTAVAGELGRKTGERRLPRRRVGARAPSYAAESDAQDGASPTLYGQALENALEEDRVTTRRLNVDELSRQQDRRDPPK